MSRLKRVSVFVILFAVGVLVAVLALTQFRRAAPARLVSQPQALPPGGSGGSTAPVPVAGAQGGQTAIGSGSVAPDAPVDLNHLPPLPSGNYLQAGEADKEDRIESNLTEKHHVLQRLEHRPVEPAR